MDDQAVVVASIIIACLMAVIAILWKTLFDPTVHQSSQARPTVGYESYDRSRFDRNSFQFSSITTAVDPVPPPLRGTEQFKKIRVIDSINLSTERIIKELKSYVLNYKHSLYYSPTKIYFLSLGIAMNFLCWVLTVNGQIQRTAVN